MDYTDVYNVIKDKLENGVPHSTVRIGDGESLLIHTTETNTPKRLNWWLNNQIGFIPDRETVLKIKELVLEGYRHSDIIGVPTQVHKDKHGPYWAKAESKLNELVPATKNINTASIDLHTELLVSGLLDKLIKSQDELVYISCRDLDNGFKRKFKLKNVYSYHLTEEQRYAVNKVKSEYYPKQYNEILEFIKNTDVKGKLCLVGAGALGKYYVWKLKEAGGIAVDIGNVMDKFAGLKTRGAGKGAGVTDETYKL